jgi:F0F1-type ATP synthase membrane subunit b/b'
VKAEQLQNEVELNIAAGKVKAEEIISDLTEKAGEFQGSRDREV